MIELPKWKKNICEKCDYYSICPIDRDCEAIKVLEWENEDLVDDNTDIGDWKA